MNTVLRVVLFVLLVMQPAAALAMHPLITDDTGTQGKGKFQLEVNGELAKDDDAGARTTAFLLNTTLAAGVTKDIDVIIGIPYVSYSVKAGGSETDERGPSDAAAEAKWRFYEAHGHSFALKPGISLPTGDEHKGLGTGKAGPYLYFIATTELEPLTLHGNIGYVRHENSVGADKDLWHLSVAAEYTVVENAKLVGNIGIERNTDPAADNDPAFLILGVVHSPAENFDIDGGVKFGLTESESDLALLAGITVRF